MKTDEIIKLLSEKRISQAMIADELGVRSPTVNQVIHKRMTSRRVQDLICEKLELTFEEVWG